MTIFFYHFLLFYFFYFSEKTSLDISCELSAWQMIHMKCQDLFSLKKKIKKKIECHLLQILLGALRVKLHLVTTKENEESGLILVYTQALDFVPEYLGYVGIYHTPSNHKSLLLRHLTKCQKTVIKLHWVTGKENEESGLILVYTQALDFVSPTWKL